MARAADTLRLTARATYFLLCYAADLYDPRDELPSGEFDACAPVDLPARALTIASATIMRRGAKRMYCTTVYAGPSVRGRLDMDATIALDRGRGASAVSVLAELSPECAQNRIIKTALRVAARCPNLGTTTRERSRLLVNALPGSPYPTIAEARRALRDVRLARGESGYRRALYWASLILRSAMPDGGYYRLDDPIDRRYLNRAFESLVRKALRRSLIGTAKVKRDRIHWNPRDEAPNGRVPVMETDATVRGHNRCLVVDAKYYAQALVTGRHGATQLRSTHLYQIASYLRALRSRDPDRRPWSACLVYACAGQSFDHRVDLGDFRLQALGLDLEQEPRLILDALASIWSAADRPPPPYIVSAPLTAQKHS